jgi:hypothetical protein
MKGNEMDEKQVELVDLVGAHKLTGVDMVTRKYERYKGWGLEDCQFINFALDGATYTAIEDPSDGYRSAMEKLIVSDEKLTNTFAPVDVIASHVDKGEWNDECDILELRDASNGKVVLRVGTSNTDDYYPCFVAEWTPENLSVNDDRLELLK